MGDIVVVYNLIPPNAILRITTPIVGGSAGVVPRTAPALLDDAYPSEQSVHRAFESCEIGPGCGIARYDHDVETLLYRDRPRRFSEQTLHAVADDRVADALAYRKAVAGRLQAVRTDLYDEEPVRPGSALRPYGLELRGLSQPPMLLHRARLHSQALAALEHPPLQHLSPAPASHPRPKAVHAHPAPILWLICSFHGSVPVVNYTLLCRALSIYQLICPARVRRISTSCCNRRGGGGFDKEQPTSPHGCHRALVMV